jgi:hypothetical protein
MLVLVIIEDVESLVLTPAGEEEEEEEEKINGRTTNNNQGGLGSLLSYLGSYTIVIVSSFVSFSRMCTVSS